MVRTKIKLLLPLIFVLSLFFSFCSLAEDGAYYKNEETGYYVSIEDDANLLTAEERSQLVDYMYPITEFGYVAFKTISSNTQSTSGYAYNYCMDNFGSNSNILFLIDMDNRELFIHSNGYINRVLGKNYANTITDNVYKYASDGNYFGCAAEAFNEVYIVLTDGKIAQPMKYICNALLAVIVAILLNYAIAFASSTTKKASAGEIVNNTPSHITVSNAFAHLTHQTRTYSPQSKSDSGGSGGGSSGGGGGSGGGHSF